MSTAVNPPLADPAGELQPLSAARRGLRLLGLVGTLLVVGLSAAYAWQSRQQQIDEAAILSHRHVARLVADLAQTLALGDAVIRQAEARLVGLAPGRQAVDALAALAMQQQPLLAALPIPMQLLAHDADGHWLGDASRWAGAGPSRIRPPAPMAGWSVEVPEADAGPETHQLLLARAAAPNTAGVAAFSVALQLLPLLRSFEAVRHQPGGSVDLLRVEPDHRGITVLARAPAVEGAIGRLIQGPVQRALPARRMGWIEDVPQSDGVRRVMAYQRLDGPAESLVLIYSLRTDDVLQAWRASLPRQALATGLLLLAVLGGLFWLDVALRRLEAALMALSQSEIRLRTLADNLPDVVVRVDRNLRHVFANPAIYAAIGLRPAQLIGRTLAEMGLRQQAQVATWTQALGRVISRGQTERLEFDLPGPDGPRHWESVLVPELHADGQVQSALGISRDVSDRVRHAEALARSELRFRLAATYGQVWEWDLAVGQVQLPPAWWQSLGHPVPSVALTGQAFEAILHPDDRAHWYQVFRDHLRHHQPFELLFRVVSASGSWRWQQTQGQSARDARGRAIYMAGTCFDVTDRQLAQQAVRDSQQRLAYLLANSPAVIYTAQPDGGAGTTYYSPNVQDLLGHEASRFIDEPDFWLAQVHPDDRSRTLAQLAKMPTEGRCVLEYRFQRADGQWRWLLDDVRLWRDADGQPVELIGSIVDVTDRHRAEDAVRSLNADLEDRVRHRTAQLQSSEARLRAIFDTVPVALNEEDWTGARARLLALRDSGVVDGPAYFADHPAFVRDCLTAVRVLRINRHPIALPGGLVDINVPFSLAMAVDPVSGLDDFRDELAALWAGQRHFTSRRSQANADGETLKLMLTLSLPAMDAAAEGLAMACLVDITEIDRLNIELDASVARLQRINSELETFSYSVSHDLKAPLRGIDGYSQLLLRDHVASLDEEAQGFLRRIRAATQQMGRLIDDLLAYSQLERRSLSKVALPLRELVAMVFTDASPAAQLQGAVLHNRVPPGLQALGDAQGLRMALRNLVDNALKFGRPGVPVEVLVDGGRCATPSGDRVRLTVQDNGIGFDMKFGERIFGIFQRLHRAELYPGTGVGLAIVRKAMDRMGGQAGAASGPGPGAVFNLDMPVA